MADYCSITLQRVLRSFNEQTLEIDECIIQLERVYREMVALDLYGEFSVEQHHALDYVKEAIQHVESILDECGDARRYQAPLLDNQACGRPRFDIPRHQIDTMLEMRFTVPSIAEILGVSIRTVRCRMADYNLSVKSLYSHLTDQQLDGIVQEIQEKFPTCGNRQIQGHLQSHGTRVQQHRVQESQRRVDPAGSVMRQLGSINRRKYHVSGSGALWHIDGHQKKIRY